MGKGKKSGKALKVRKTKKKSKSEFHQSLTSGLTKRDWLLTINADCSYNKAIRTGCKRSVCLSTTTLVNTIPPASDGWLLRKMKRFRGSKTSLNLGFLEELGAAFSPERDSKKERKKGGNPSYRSGAENKRTGRSYNKLFSVGGWDLEKSPVKRDGPYIANGSRDDFLPQNIDVHVSPPGIPDKPQEQERMHKHEHKSEYPCGGRLRAYFHRTEYASHYNIPGESGYGEISILNRFPVHGRRL